MGYSLQNRQRESFLVLLLVLLVFLTTVFLFCSSSIFVGRIVAKLTRSDRIRMNTFMVKALRPSTTSTTSTATAMATRAIASGAFLKDAGMASVPSTSVLASSMAKKKEEEKSTSMSLRCCSSTTPSSSSPTTTKHKKKKKKFVDSLGDYRDELFLEDHQSPLYETQPHLPPLPVPSLEETIETFLPTALPLASDNKEEIQSLRHACESFPKQALQLQKRLLQRQDDLKKHTSWKQQWWNQECYLKVRDPLFFVSYYYRLQYDTSCKGNGLNRAAAALQATALYAQQVRTGSKQSEKVGRKQMPLCSTQFKYLFNSCRIPGIVTQDMFRVYYNDDNDNDNDDASNRQYVVIACRGQFYKVVVENKEGLVYNRQTLRAALEKCVQQPSMSQITIPELGFLTTTDRDTWAKNYAFLSQQNEEMKDALEELQSAIGVFALDIDDDDDDNDNNEDTLLSESEHARRLWHGNHVHSSNRWMDKSFNVVINSRGQLGYVGEHSMMDGLPAVSLCCQMMDEGKVANGDPPEVSDNNEEDADTSLTPVPIFEEAFSKLDKSTIADIQARVDKARSDLSERINQHDLQVLTYDKYGDTKIKQAGYSPDAFVQQAMQLAAFRLFGTTVGTYEATQTRKFLHGRTETTRSVSPESQAFVKAMDDSSTTATTHDEKANLLEAATKKHSEYIRKAVNGYGVDRHLFGLSMMQEKNEVAPDLFSHPLFVASKTWRLTTSQVPRARCGFSQVEDDGIGIGYDIETNALTFSIHGLKETHYVERMIQLLQEALDEMNIFL